MNEFRALLWATDNIELGNIGARQYIKFTLHTPKKGCLTEFYYIDYDFNMVLNKAIEFILTNSKRTVIHKSLYENI